MNILLLSIGTRNKIVQYFKKELNGNGLVIATDCSNLAPAIYDADKYYIVPPISSVGYIDEIFKICKNEKINGVLSFIDPELSLLAQYTDKFRKIGVTPIISDYEKVELCFDKYQMYQFLIQNKYNCAKSYIDKNLFYEDLEKGDINLPVFVKPIRGSASINVNKADSEREVELLFEKYDGLMIQEYIDGVEYGADVYIDMLSGEVTDIFIKEKLKMRAGETDKSVSVKNDTLFIMIENFVKTINLRGIIDIDIFYYRGMYYISEVNPRFGGGYPHAYECGVNIPKCIINNLQGMANCDNKCMYDENVYMMKYNEIKILRIN